MRVMAIDIGITTGWAIVEDGGDFRASGTMSVGEKNLWRYLKPPDVVVIERVAYAEGPRRAIMQQVTEVFEKLFPDAVWIKAGDWKPITGSQPVPKIPEKPKTTTHEKDAYRIGLYWLWKQGLYTLKPRPHTTTFGRIRSAILGDSTRGNSDVH